MRRRAAAAAAVPFYFQDYARGVAHSFTRTRSSSSQPVHINNVIKEIKILLNIYADTRKCMCISITNASDDATKVYIIIIRWWRAYVSLISNVASPRRAVACLMMIRLFFYYGAIKCLTRAPVRVLCIRARESCASKSSASKVNLNTIKWKRFQF